MSLQEYLKDKKILVTGAGRGVGKALCQRLHEYGAIVFALSQNANNLAALKSECPRITTICADLSNWEATRAEILKLDVLDGLINNAGVHEADGFMNITSEQLDRILGVNVKAVVNVSQVISKKMIEAGTEGSIVNVSSVAAKRAMPWCTVYCASKAALDMISKNMAVELGPHKIRVNSFNPAGIDTDMSKKAALEMGKHVPESAMANYMERIPYGDGMIPMDEIVNTTLFILSGMAKSMTGETVVIDGGFLTT